MKTAIKNTAARSFKLAKFYTMMRRILFFSAIVIMMVLTSCTKGRNGRDGLAYVSVTWDVDRPDYIDVGNPSFPRNFFFGEFYRVYPGRYFMYYEGVFWNGYAFAHYAWDVEYEVWENRGEAGGYYYDGRDGIDNYFSLRCTPYGPYTYQLKSESANDNTVKIKENKDGKLVITEEKEFFTIRITYSKATPSKLSDK